MKKICYSLCCLFISFQLFSQETEKLTKIPWEEIVEITSNIESPFLIWKKDINVNLKGNYTTKDSLEVLKFIKKIDELTETINIKISDTVNSNLIIQFNDYESSRNRITQYNTDLKSFKELVKAKVYIYNNERDDSTILLKARIASVIVKGSFINPKSLNRRTSIFNSFNLYNKKHQDLNKQDYLILNKVYSHNFKNNLSKAKEKYPYVVSSLQKKMFTNYRQKWWYKNPFAVVFIPTLLLIVLMVYIVGKIKIIVETKINRNWLQFGVISLISLLLLGIVIVFSVSVVDFLVHPKNYNYSSYIRSDTIVVTLIFLLISFPFLFLFRFLELKIQKIAKKIFTKSALIFLSTGVLPFICFLIPFLLISDDKQSKKLNYLLSIIFSVAMIIATIRALISYFIFKEKKLILDNELKLSNLRELKTKAELKSLQAQINPHFLYNSLNSIASLAPIDAVKTQKMAHSLSDLFKYSINRKNENVGFIKDEIEMVKTYLEIEKIRFGNHLQFTIDVDTTLENHKIPLFLIQPLVENAVKHGISKNVEEGHIDINIKKKNNEICISVSDNGPNFPEGLISGHGLQTVYDLLRLNYKGKASLNWTNTPQKKIIITIPETL